MNVSNSGPELRTGLRHYKFITSQEENRMDKYECQACGYVYDPEKGDPDNGIPAGTSFEALPDDWTCPMCGVGKDMFEKI